MSDQPVATTTYAWDHPCTRWRWRDFVKDPRAFIWAAHTTAVCRVLGHKPEPPEFGGETLVSLLSDRRIKAMCMRCAASLRPSLTAPSLPDGCDYG